MKIPFGTLSISERSRDLISKALASNRVSGGRYVREFEEAFADVLGVKEAVAVSSGTDALTLALAVMRDFGVKRGAEVIVPALSFVATGNAVLQAGYKPVFVDVKPETLNIDVDRLEEAVTPETKAIVPVHLMGKPAGMDPINELAERYDLFVIEDAAEAYGTSYKGKPAGTIGDMAAFSLYVAHMITSVEGGMAVTDNKDFAGILRSLRSHGRACKCKSCVLNIRSGYCRERFTRGRNGDIRFMFERIGFSSKMNELEAAVGLGSLDNYSRILEKRRENLLYIKELFKKFRPHLFTIAEDADEKIGPHAFPIILDKKAWFSRDEFSHFLEASGVETRTLFLSMPTQCPGFEYLGYKPGQFPAAEYIGHNGLHIGIHQDLEAKHLDYIADITGDFLSRHAGSAEKNIFTTAAKQTE